MKSAVDISIIIVNWQVRHLVEKCLLSIKNQSDNINVEIIVIDNDSHDGLAEMLMMDWPEVKYVGLIKNYGFAKASNLGINMATGKYICLLNPDTEIRPGFLVGVLEYFASHSEVDIIGPRLLNSDGSLQASVRRLPNFTNQALTLLKLQNIVNPSTQLDNFLPKYLLWLGKLLRRLGSGNKSLSDYLINDFDYQKEQVVEQLMGAVIVCREAVFKKIGKLDEKFYIWFEEVDFCWRATKAGLVMKYVPSLQVIHHGGQSFAQARSLKKQWIFDRSLLYFFRKYHPVQALGLTLLVPINLFLTFIYAVVVKTKK